MRSRKLDPGEIRLLEPHPTSFLGVVLWLPPWPAEVS